MCNTPSLCGVTSNDTVYTVLPLYHVMGLVLGVLSSLQLGSTCVLAPKFSASGFWDDCRQHGVTVVLYVGEVLRYLCSSPQVRCSDYSSTRNYARSESQRASWAAFTGRFGHEAQARCHRSHTWPRVPNDKSGTRFTSSFFRKEPPGRLPLSRLGVLTRGY